VLLFCARASFSLLELHRDGGLSASLHVELGGCARSPFDDTSEVSRRKGKRQSKKGRKRLVKAV